MKYSIIIPYYEDSRLIRLLESIPLSRNDLEVLVIDDASKKLPARVVCSQYTYLNNFHIISLSVGLGAGHARNVGLARSKGQWILFADADDFFLNDAFELIDMEVKKGSDLIFFKPVSLQEEGGTEDRAEPLRQMCVDAIASAEGALSRIKVNFVVPWSKVYSANLIKIKNIRFEEIRFGNDVLFSVSYALEAKKVSVSGGEIYCVTDTLRSLTNIKSEESFDCRFLVLLRKNKMIRLFGMSSYQTPTMGLILYSRVYGIESFLKYFFLSIRNGSPLITIDQIRRYFLKLIQCVC